MNEYLIKTTTHTTGEVFTDIVPIKDNEHYEFITADNKYEAFEKYEEGTKWK